MHLACAVSSWKTPPERGGGGMTTTAEVLAAYAVNAPVQYHLG